MSRTRSAKRPVERAGSRLPPEQAFWPVAAICAALALLAAFVFAQTLRDGFLNMDDSVYVSENPDVLGGLTRHGIVSVFSHPECRFYHPLTMLSLMADTQIYGVKPWGYRLTNILLHAASAILLFLVLRRMTDSLWPCAFVAAVFAVHPLHVESVVWIAERKDVLSGFFFILTLAAYVHYARAPFSPWRYASVLVLFAAGLLAKPNLVTVPFLFLLLDYWPLKRFQLPGPDRFILPKQLLLEKLLLLALAVAASWLAVVAQEDTVDSPMPASLRIGNAFVSYAVYLVQTFWPARLVPFYPFPANGLPPWQIASSIVLLLAITAAVVLCLRSRPYLALGWFWFLGMLVPMIGFIKIGSLGRADHFMYLPQIGITLLVAWLGAGLVARRPGWGPATGAFAAFAVGALALAGRTQASLWSDTESLWRRTIACTTGNLTAYNNLGDILYHEGRVDEAIPQYLQALAIRPALQDTLYNLGTAYFQKNEPDRAIPYFEKALEAAPGFGDAHYNLANALLREGRVREAAEHFSRAIQLKPRDIGARNNLAWLLATCPDDTVRDGGKAVELAEQASRLANGHPITLNTLAAAYAEAGRFPEALQTADRARESAAASGNTAFADAILQEMQRFQAGEPWRESPR